MEVVLTTGPSNSLGLKCHYLEVIPQASATLKWIKAFHQLGILSGDTCRVFAFVPVIIGSRSGTQFIVLSLPFRVIVAQSD